MDVDDSVQEPDNPSRNRGLQAGFLILILGLVVIVSTAFLEKAGLKSQVWGEAAFVLEGVAPWPDAFSTYVRHVPLDHFPMQESMVAQARDSLAEEDVNALALDMTESIMMIEVPAEELEGVLAGGRVPSAGEPEVIAGAFTRLSSFELDGTTFRVVGRLQRGVPGLYFSYLLPADATWHPIFIDNPEATSGWFDPRGAERMVEMDDLEALLEEQDILYARAPARLAHVYAVFFGLVLVALGGAIAHVALFRRLAEKRIPFLSPVFVAVRLHGGTVLGMHILMYGSFFTMMLVGIRLPFISIYLQEYIWHTFTEGGLGYIGAAYESGNVLLAAGATFLNNYIVQTVFLTVAISFVVPMIGVLKTLASFTIVGLGMPPLWAGMAGTFVFHSITMTLELEAYVFACVAVCVFWFHVGKGLIGGTLKGELIAGLKVVGSGTLLAGIMLAMAGLYEATTLILLR